jgi:hypothetical protein
MPRFTLMVLSCARAGAAACATVGPIFEVHFYDPETVGTHGRWVRFLATRYLCDTVLMRGSQIDLGPTQPEPAAPGVNARGRPRLTPTGPLQSAPGRRSLLGLSPCQLASARPTTVRSYRMQDGRISDEWLQGVAIAFRLEGPDPAHLRVVAAP